MNQTQRPKSVIAILQARYKDLDVRAELARAQDASDRAEGVIAPQHQYLVQQDAPASTSDISQLPEAT